MDNPYSDDATSALRAEQEQLVERSQAILAAAHDEPRELTSTEVAEIRAATARFDTIDEQLRAHESVAALTASSGRRTEPDRPGGSRGALTPAATGVPSRGRTYAQMFGAHRDDQGWRSPGEFLQTLSRGHSDHRFVATSVEHTGTAGGYMVPSQLVAAILDRSLQDEVIRPGATVFPMASNALTISGRDTENRANGDVAGLKLVWLGENVEGSVDDPIFRPVNLTAHKAAILSEASVELLADALNFTGQLTEGFAQSTRVGLDLNFIQGDGVAKPLGILNSPALITVAAESPQAADTILFSNIRAMMSRLLPGSFTRSVWVAHPSVLDQLLILNHEFSGGTGELVNAFQMVGDEWRLMGRPVRWTECSAELGSVGDLILADLSYYAIGMRREAGMETSNAPGWKRFAQSFRFYLRLDGTPLLSQPVTPVKGSTTLSPFIALAERA